MDEVNRGYEKGHGNDRDEESNNDDTSFTGSTITSNFFTFSNGEDI